MDIDLVPFIVMHVSIAAAVHIEFAISVLPICQEEDDEQEFASDSRSSVLGYVDFFSVVSFVFITGGGTIRLVSGRPFDAEPV